MEQEKEDNIAQEKRKKEEEKKREKEREREREERQEPTILVNSPSLSSPQTEANLVNPVDKAAATQVALEQAQQLELQKKLMSGSESSTLSQQENMQIKGQSARHLVMQKLMGARGGMRESKVLCLKNMVGSDE